MKILAILFCCLISHAIHAAELPHFPYVTATGFATKEVPPDTATIHMNFMAFHQASKAAVARLNTATTALAKTMEKYNIPSKQLDARDIRKTMKRNRNRNFESLEILGYEVSRSMTLTLENVAAYPKLIDELAGIDHLTSMNVEFDTRQRAAAERELMALAGKDARKKAEAMAAGLGNKIQSVYGITQEGRFGQPVTRFQLGRAELEQADASGPNTDIMLVPESITLEQTLQVIFRIK